VLYRVVNLSLVQPPREVLLALISEAPPLF